MGLKSYIKNIKETLDSTFEGMGITLSNFLQRPVTFEYHSYGDKKRMDKSLAKAGLKDYSETISEGYRGVLEVDIDTCTGCGLCEKACPIDVIIILKSKNEENRMVVDRFAIDNTKCMYCGLCSIPCPTEAIKHTKTFEASNYYTENLVYEWAGKDGYVAYNAKKDGERQRAELGSRIKEKLIHATTVPAERFPIKVKPPKVEKVKYSAPPVVSGNRKSRKAVEVIEEEVKKSPDVEASKDNLGEKTNNNPTE
jgi:formate hydrogenlyase subunit 6/NADH:ubiquinone oxidoreductase subunit I